jgi:hypothetical protein
MSANPTIFHVTHWKAGSQWVRAILQQAAPDRFIKTEYNQTQFFQRPIQDGHIYTPVYATYEAFRSVVPANREQKTFAVIRDPRDALVSWYFSMKISHKVQGKEIGDLREALNKVSKEDGIAMMIRGEVYDAVAIQSSWLSTNTFLIRYEDLVTDQQVWFKKIFAFCELPIKEFWRRRLIRRNSFARQTWWRFGREDVTSHLRKGKVGDWKNHFNDSLKQLFKEHHGQALIQAGYEKSMDW